MKGSTEDKNHNPILHITWIISLYFFHKQLVSLSCLGVGIQLLPFIDNSHLGSILRFQLFSCLPCYKCFLPAGIMQEGFQERLFTFSNFERVFEECISKTAVKTKFESHTNRGKNITTELKTFMEDILQKSLSQR